MLDILGTLCGCVGHVFMVEKVSHNIRPALRLPQVAADVFDQFKGVARAPAADGVGFHGVVQILVRVQFWTIVREEVHANALAVQLQPLFHPRRAMHRMTVPNQEQLLWAQANQPLEKPNANRRRETLFENHERHSPAIGHRRAHVAPETTPRAENDRRLSATAVTPAALMIAPQAHLVAPMNLGLFALRLATNGRVRLLQPTLYRRRVLFIRPAKRLLRRQSTMRQVTTDGPNRDIQRITTPKQLSHRLARPQGKWQPQLVRTTAFNHSH